MRKLFFGLALGAMVLFGGSAAQAGQLAAATFSLTLTGLPPAAFTATFPNSGSGGSATGGPGSTATWSVQPNMVPGGTASASINSLAAPPLTYIQIIVNSNPLTGNFAHTSGGAMLLTGVANVFGLGGYPNSVLLGVPLKVGAPGTVMAAGYGVFITALANSWTTKTTTIGLLEPLYVFHTSNSGTDQTVSVTTTPNGKHTITANGGVGATITTTINTVTATGANGLNAGTGTVVLVSAVNVLTSISGQIPTFAVLTLEYVPHIPEPGTLLLLGSGLAGLVLIGRRKMR